MEENKTTKVVPFQETTLHSVKRPETLRCNGRLSKKGRRADALALRADEGRDKLR